MVSNKNSKKARKPIETTLGKAAVKPKEKENDISHLRKPIETSVSGIKQILSILETATNEVKNLLMFECDIMYECRICRTIFRSLANFILHKRNYCKDKFSPVNCVDTNDTFKIDIDPAKELKKETSTLAKVIQKLHHIDRVRESAKQFLTVDLTSEPGGSPIKSMDDREEKASNFNKMILEKIDSNDSGIFQTLVNDSRGKPEADRTKGKEFMKSEVMEIHKKIENDIPVLDPDGKICGFTSNKLYQTSLFPKSEFKCTECNNRFATQKSLTNHMKCIHNPSRIVYVCPTCKDTFANPWCVYRHLLKVHRMTNKQVRRMREQVHNNWIRRDEEPSTPKKKSGINQGAGDSENQWINDIEGDKDFQMCAGCGKHFERKAALHSHSQMCAKRLEVCNNIKENAKKKGEEEAIEKAKLEKMASDKLVLKGASKRKGINVCSFRKSRHSSFEINEPITHEIDDSSIEQTTSESKVKSDISNGVPNCKDETVTFNVSSEEATKTPNDKVLTEAKAESAKNDSMSVSLEPVKIRNFDNIGNSLTSTISEDLLPKETSLTLIDSTNEPAKHTKDTKISGTLKPSCSEVLKDIDKSNIQLMDRISKENATHASHSEKQPKVDIPTVESRSSSRGSSVVRCFASSLHADKNMRNKPSRSNSFVESTVVLDHSPSSSYEIVSDSTSVEDAIYLSSSEESLRGNSPPNTKDPTRIKREKQEEHLSVDSGNSSKSVCVISNENEPQEATSSVFKHTDTEDLFSNEISFEMFCKKVGKRNENESNINANNAPTLRTRKRKLDEDDMRENHSNASSYSDNDEVIFVGETKNNNSFIGVENGFHGFSSEETSQTSFPIDFSNLSYNNPLKSNRKDSSAVSTDVTSDNVLVERKLLSEEIQLKGEISKDVKEEFNFIPRAAPYMDREKLSCIPCGLTFQSFSLLLWHMSAHFSWFRFQCSKCSFITFNKYDCLSHAKKDHDLGKNSPSNYILPLPNWKTVLMSNEFRLLKDCDDLKGKHTDEKIGIDESQDHCSDAAPEILESSDILFEESPNSDSKSNSMLEKGIAKKRNRVSEDIIDIQDAIQDSQKLPEPVELAMPADVSEIFRTFAFDENTLSPVEKIEALDHCGDESNDDWGLTKVCEESRKPKTVDAKSTDEDNVKDEISSPNIRPSRIRTKVKQNDDFVYYDNGVNSGFKVTELFKSGSQKLRSNSVATVKPKVSSKSVPTIQKKKS